MGSSDDLLQKLVVFLRRRLSALTDVFRILRSSSPGNASQPDGHVSERDADTPRPETIGTRVIFLPRDPQWAVVYWQIDTSDHQRAMASGAKDLCLRLADVTGLIGGAAHPHTLQEIVVEEMPRSGTCRYPSAIATTAWNSATAPMTRGLDLPGLLLGGSDSWTSPERGEPGSL